ncbi:hypothetical protein N7519_005149 [Penicillium mononematosum]|uniref:uncharacterized protein n=1 Tax=Penicillium mononematosum TaxID=268346 RepID=UPI002546B32C|nr:uncharacterized protein N7519_005149 [Penicillium mononematosum]KAJ6183848.1 hypothetical protein N7519_005149 [Penicillium mononematosum]
MPFNVYKIQDWYQNYVFYIEFNTITKGGEVESTGWTHSFESDQKDGNQYTARLHSTLRSFPIGRAIATIEEADLPKFHKLCFAAIGPVPHKKCPSRSGVHTMMPSPWKQDPWEWWRSVHDRSFEKGIFKPHPDT